MTPQLDVQLKLRIWEIIFELINNNRATFVVDRMIETDFIRQSNAFVIKKKSNFTHFSICVPIIVTPPENRLYGSILKILLLIDFLKKHQKNNLFCLTYSFTFIFIIRAIFHFPIESLTM